jgi:membrane-associated phospholipid phosphatase
LQEKIVKEESMRETLIERLAKMWGQSRLWLSKHYQIATVRCKDEFQKTKAVIGELVRKYKHAWVFSYIFFYGVWFYYLEHTERRGYYIIHSRLDDKIPFIEYFIVPYTLWFVFIAVVFLYFFFTDVDGFYRMSKFIFLGMTIFLVISTLVPNGLELRPTQFARDNLFIRWVQHLYRIDTPTNVLPSLHVFNSVAVCLVMNDSERVRKHKIVCALSYVLAGLIVLATMFLKQHSVIDVWTACVMAAVLYGFFYELPKRRQEKETSEVHTE